MTPSSMASAWFTKDTSFDFSLSNTGNKSVTGGLIGDQHDQRCVSLGKYPGGHLFGCGFTFWIHGFVSSASCSPTCSSTLTISTSGSTPAGTSAIAVAATSGGLTRTTSFNLTVNLPTAAAPTISPKRWQLYELCFGDVTDSHLRGINLLHNRRFSANAIIDPLRRGLGSNEQRNGKGNRL